LKADPKGVLTGAHYLDGDHAITEGALAAGCRFFGGYPITPSTETAERFSARIPHIGGIFIQMEDELGSIAAVLGAAWAGQKAMTITSGPGFSLMMENFGLGAMMEVPCVIANVQRGGPSTGLPTEKVVIPPAEEIELTPRRWYEGPKDEYLPYVPDADMVPPMIKAGDGYRFHTTGLTHDERGYPVINAECQEKLVRRLVDKIRKTRKAGIKVGTLRLITVWPFPEKRVKELSKKIKAWVVPEINYGQIVLEVERCAAGQAEAILVPHGGGWVHDPMDILKAIKEAVR